MATDADSARATGGMWATAQGGGNMLSSNEEAMTAPGSKPVTPMPSLGEQQDPAVAAEHVAPSVLVDGGEPEPGAAWDDVSGRRAEWGPS
jgi:hypothetical protein